MLQKARLGDYTERDLQDTTRFFGVKRIQQVLHKAEYLASRKMKLAPTLIPAHKRERVNWARECLRMKSVKSCRII